MRMRVRSSLWSRWARRSGAANERRHLADLVEAEAAFRRRLSLEVERASRLDRPFAVIAFGRGDAVSRSELSRLAAMLRGRLRATDAVGWLGAHELGLLLRYTTSAH